MADKYQWLKALPQFEMFLRTWTALRMGLSGRPVSPAAPCRHPLCSSPRAVKFCQSLVWTHPVRLQSIKFSGMRVCWDIYKWTLRITSVPSRGPLMLVSLSSGRPECGAPEEPAVVEGSPQPFLMFLET